MSTFITNFAKTNKTNKKLKCSPLFDSIGDACDFQLLLLLLLLLLPGWK